MIKIEELKIGNWVSNIHGIPMIVDTIYYDSINMDLTISDGVALELLQPIPLTEEIFLSVEGVVKHPTIENKYELEDYGIYFNIEDGYWDEPSLDIFVGGTYITCVEYVHELQNTMYWLIREELKIKL